MLIWITAASAYAGSPEIVTPALADRSEGAMDRTPQDPNDPYTEAPVFLNDDGTEGECWQCGGEGYLYDCFDGMCEYADDGCEDCAKRCDSCKPRNADAGVNFSSDPSTSTKP